MARQGNYIEVEISVGMYDLPRLSRALEKSGAVLDSDFVSFILGEKVESTFAGVFKDKQ